MSSVARPESRKASKNRAVLMRTAATALIAVSPFVYSGASAATTSASAQLTAPVLRSGQAVSKAQQFTVQSITATKGGLQLEAPLLRTGWHLGDLATAGNFKLSAPALPRFSIQASSAAGQPVQNLLAVPMAARAGTGAFGASTLSISTMAATQTYDNGSDITVSDAETAIEIDANPDSIIVTNTGDLTGGGGISVSTGRFDPTATPVNSQSYNFINQYASPLYDDAGNRVQEPCSWDPAYSCDVIVNTGSVDTTIIANDIDASQSDAEIHINNGGQIDFSGVYGIRAENQAGTLIDITNTGDITSTADTERRVGIFADTSVDVIQEVDGPNEIVAGEYTFNSYGQLTGVITEGQHEKTTTTTRPVNDGGAIVINNSGLIDMGVVDVSEIPPGYSPAYVQSEGIYARGAGGIDITNQLSGTIKVGDFSHGMTIVSGGEATIENAGTIQIGNHAKGIYVVAGPLPSGDLYGGGDTTIINSGDIIGGMTKAEAAASPNANAFPGIQPAHAIGIQVYALGTNRDGYGFLPGYFETLQEYADLGALDPESIPDLSEYFPNLKDLTTNIVNTGSITLKDGALGIYGTSVYGDINVYNNGTITVGNGASRFQDNFDLRAMGIYLNNFPVSGSSDFVAHNGANGVIITGDDGAGMVARTAGGSATVINEGTIEVGNGGVGDHTTYGDTYDWLFPSMGMSAQTVGAGIGQSAIAVNSGTITTGDLSTGIHVAGNNGGFAIPLLPYRVTAELVNSGTVTTGANSTGLSAFGENVVVVNTGSVTIGDLDLSGFDLPPDYLSAGAQNFASLGHGILAKSTLYGAVYNEGSVTTGDNTIGIYHGMRRPGWGRASFTIQGEDGIVSTGDNSVGIKNFGTLYTVLDNAGTISVGNNSIGADIKAGTVYHDYYDQAVVISGRAVASNSGLIETGDNSVGVRLTGAEFGATHTWQDFDFETYSMITRTVTGDILGEALLQNTGTIRVGANSTAVEISGYGYYGINLYNIGTIDAGQGTAIKVNADNVIGSTILNGGTIIGDILLGDGDDTFLHAQNVDPDTGQALGTGNIIMDGHTIDFGGGTNLFRIQQGVISVAGGDDNLITGDNLTVEMEYGEIDARDDFITGPSPIGLASAPLSHLATNFSTLTIDGDVSGIMRFATDVGPDGESDELNITGDVLAGSDIGFILNPVEQLSGEVEIRPMNIGGANGAEFLDVAGVSGLYADSLIEWETTFEASTGDVVINALFGLGHMGTAANAAAVSAQNWLAGSMSSYDKRNIHAYTGRKGEGLAIWGYAFQDEGEIRPDSDLQDLSFRQISSGLQAGVQWSQDVWGGRVAISPMFTYGTAEANLIANTASSRSHPWAIGLNANYAQSGGLYVDATYQRMRMDVDLKTPGSVTQATGEAKVSGQGFNLEAGYSHKLTSGLVLEPQLQLTHTKVDVDDFATSDGIYELTDIDGKATTLRAGVSAYKEFKTKSGSITPQVSLSYLNAIDGDTQLASNGVEFDSDTSGMGYKAEVGIAGRHYAWDFAAKLGVSKTGATGSILQPSLSIRRALGGDAAQAQAAEVALPEVTEATVKFADAGNAAAPMATAAPASDGAAVVSANYAQTGTDEPVKQEGEGEEPVQTAPELEPEQPAEEASGEEETIVVTGSIVPRGMPKDMSPVTVITSEQMAIRGLTTLGEVLDSFTQNSGVSQGQASNLLGRFTHGAEEVNMRGLGAGRTLVLVNGRRLADYPLPFGGEQNAFDLGAIPNAAIANVQYLSSGASATYGSDAVGGVVNIITKRDMEQTIASVDGGINQGGYGEWGRASVITGNSFAKGSFTVGAEGVYAGEALASDSKWLRKNAPFNAGMVSIREATMAGISSALPASACAPLGFEYDSEFEECTKDVGDTISLSPSLKKVSAFFDGRYDLTDKIELFASGMGAKSWIEARSNVLFWQGVVEADDGSAASLITRGFSEDELGISKVNVDQTMWSAVAGAKGSFGLGKNIWYWDLSLSHASYKTDQTTINLKEEGIKNWILAGASSVTDSPDARYTYLVDPDFYNNQLVDNVIRPVEPSDIDSLIGENVLKASSTAQTLSATLNGEIGDLGFLFKPARLAARAEYARQTTEIRPDERTLNTSGEGWYNIGSVQAKGERSRWALAAEIDASVLQNLDIMLAARYDHYDDASSVGGRLTGQAKFLYRPNDWLKIRGGYGQTFRAPDMFNIYGETDAFEFVPDYSAPGCFDGTNYICGGFQVASTRRADPGLSEEHGDDIGLGMIFNPIPNFTVSIDWYRIKLKDLVVTESSAELLLKEWQCDNGVLDGSSQLCDDVHSRVIRNGFGAVERVIVQPINQDNLTQQGIDMAAQYRFESARLGQFTAGIGYSKVLKFKLNRFAGDEPIDLKYGEPGASTPGNRMSASLTWFQPLTTNRAISAGLFVQRQGRVKNFDHSQFLEPFYDVNLTVGYQLNARTQARFEIDNLLNADPVPNGSNVWPGYWAHMQDAFGRSFVLSISHSFN